MPLAQFKGSVQKSLGEMHAAEMRGEVRFPPVTSGQQGLRCAVVHFVSARQNQELAHQQLPFAKTAVLAGNQQIAQLIAIIGFGWKMGVQ